ncbi:hypothetical protein MNBD_UNCLBAC01-1634 [hydrothermal vent metagenome]|uniref:Uncharacterized protein n=1 Tax=hydrothermal vent metagenome TaxID=652676 RepID=A0A3B1DNH2_9ZZZZ
MKKFLNLKAPIIFLSIGLIGYSGFFLFVYIMSQVIGQKEPPLEPGSQFAHFAEHLEGQTHIGFLTDKDMSAENNDGFFSQTQYILAPVIVELNVPKHEYSVVDYTNYKHLLYTMRLLKAKRIAHNEYGQALVQRKLNKK